MSRVMLEKEKPRRNLPQITLNGGQDGKTLWRVEQPMKTTSSRRTPSLPEMASSRKPEKRAKTKSWQSNRNQNRILATCSASRFKDKGSTGESWTCRSNQNWAKYFLKSDEIISCDGDGNIFYGDYDASVLAIDN